MKVLLVDPSLFTAPYNAALDGGLRANGVAPSWAVRDLRAREERDLPEGSTALAFYPWTDGPQRRQGKVWKIVKGVEHWLGLRKLERVAEQFDVVHFQWTPLPSLDVPAMRRIRRKRPVVLTVHDTEAFNGANVSPIQARGFDALFDAADHLIVHTPGARDTLIRRGAAAERISVIPHGPLALRCTPRPVTDKAPGRWRVVLFGRLQTYKGVDLLIEALGRIPAEQRERLEVVVAGEPFMAVEPLQARAVELGITSPTLQLRLGRLSDQEMADLLTSADAFVFPYRAIEASGVLFLIAGLRKWIVASALGAFTDALGTGEGQGSLVPPGDIDALAAALGDSIGRTPDAGSMDWAPDWQSIGARTCAIYEQLLHR